VAGKVTVFQKRFNCSSHVALVLGEYHINFIVVFIFFRNRIHSTAPLKSRYTRHPYICVCHNRHRCFYFIHENERVNRELIEMQKLISGHEKMSLFSSAELC